MNVSAAGLIAKSDIWLYLLPSFGSMLLFYGIWQVFVESRSTNQKKMQERLRGDRREEKVAASILRRSSNASTMADAILGKFKFIPKLQVALDQADISWNASKAILNLSGAAVLTAAGLLLINASWFAAIGCACGVMILPLVWINFRRKMRMTKLCGQLPDVFEMMSQALRAGHSLAGAIQLIYEQMPPPIATEFAQVYHEQNLGVRVEDALRAMAERVDSLDVRFFVTAVMIQRQTGGDLAEVLDNISSVIRERIELAGLVRGLTAEGRLSGWVLFALPALVFVASMYLNPNYARVLLEDPRGQIMLMIAAGMQLMGIAMIRWIVNIKV